MWKLSRKKERQKEKEWKKKLIQYKDIIIIIKNINTYFTHVIYTHHLYSNNQPVV